jgi:hypothetical protein
MTVTPKKLSNKIKSQLTKEYRKRLGIGPRDPLPDDIKKGINSAAKTAAQRATQRNLESEALKVAKGFYQPFSISELIADKLGQAKKGVSLVAQSADLNEILKENATMLRKKWQALVNAGFQADEAFQLILAEVQGKAARRGNV